jgi:hypothetical protein
MSARNIEGNFRFGDGTPGMSTPANILAEAVGLGAFPEGTVLYQGLKDNGELGFDKRNVFYKWIRHKYVKMKSSSAPIDSTTALLHTTTDQEIIDTTRKETPLLELLPMETARGKTASYDVLTARGAASFITETQSLSTISPVADTYLNATKALCIGTSPGGWSDFGLSAMASAYPTRDARALEIRNKTWSGNELWENELINGSSTSGAAAAGFIGIRGEIYDSRTTWASTIPSGNSTSLNYNKSGAALTDDDIDIAIADGTSLNVKYNLALTDLITWKNIKQIMQQLVRYVNPETEIAWGLKALAWNTPYGVIPIVASKFMNYGAGAHELLLLDTKFLAQRVLLDSTMEMFAKTALQQTFVIKKFATFIDKTQAYTGTYNTNSFPATPAGTGTSKMARIYAIA